MRKLIVAAVLGALALPAAAQQSRPHNIVLFVADGLRPGMVNAQTAPPWPR